MKKGRHEEFLAQEESEKVLKDKLKGKGRKDLSAQDRADIVECFAVKFGFVK